MMLEYAHHPSVLHIVDAIRTEIQELLHPRQEASRQEKCAGQDRETL